MYLFCTEKILQSSLFRTGFCSILSYRSSPVLMLLITILSLAQDLFEFRAHRARRALLGRELEFEKILYNGGVAFISHRVAIVKDKISQFLDNLLEMYKD